MTPASEAGALSGLNAGATAVRKTGRPATVVLWDPAGAFDFRPGTGKPEPDLSGLTVILDGGGEAARRWVPIAQAAGAACVALIGTGSGR